MSQPSVGEISGQTWDVIVIGTGIGGGTVGRRLAEGGMKVLFLEKGYEDVRSAQNGMTEAYLPKARLKRGIWPVPLHTRVNGREDMFYPPLGAGPGGSSAFYAATLERPERHDIDDSAERPHPTGGWPVSFDAKLPYYAEAARRFRIYGTHDPLSTEEPIPLRDPPPFTKMEVSLMESLRAVGLHPYHAHTAVERVEGCLNCLSHKCPKTCKMDGRSAGLEPALATGNAALLTGAEVTRLVDDGQGAISHVEAQIDGQTHAFRAKRYILSGGAMHSPRLLLRSTSEAFPNGLANGSGLVGRNLMLHSNEIFALWAKVPSEPKPSRAVALRDLYYLKGKRLGSVRAMGIRASYGEIIFFIQRLLAARGLSKLSPFARIPAAIAQRLFGTAEVFVGLMEDLPYPENRVLYDPSDPDRLAIDYTINDELMARRKMFRRAIWTALKGHKRVFFGFAPDLNWGHACGTLRFGHDPETSVLRADGRAHEVENLWVADASFMPTSMGVNPSLTIAAYALHVADSILKSEETRAGEARMGEHV
jgi:choline dehydrogenase-like flavoprotein